MTRELRATHLNFVRHGQSISNVESGISDQDSGLTELGWLQAQAVADWLARTYRADAVTSSTLRRARQTAAVIAERLSLPLLFQAGLEEAEQPYWEELPSTPSHEPLAFWDANWQPTPEGAPIYSEFRRRVRKALAEVLSTHSEETIIIVAHGGTIGTILRSVIGGHQVAMHTENTGVTHIAWQDGRWRLILHNSQVHLSLLESLLAGQTPSSKPLSIPWGKDDQIRAVLEQYKRVAQASSLRAAASRKYQEVRQVVRMASLTKRDTLLDVGCGSGAVTLDLAPHVFEAFGVDISPAMLELAERSRIARNARNVEFRWGEATQLPFPAGAIDVVFCQDLLRYLPDPTSLFAECCRVLAPGGRFVLDEVLGTEDLVRRATQEAIELVRDPAVVKLHGLEDIRRALQASGLSIAKLDMYEKPETLEDWLASAATPDLARQKVRLMMEASLEADAAGLHAKRDRSGSITFRQSRARVLASPEQGAIQ